MAAPAPWPASYDAGPRAVGAERMHLNEMRSGHPPSLAQRLAELGPAAPTEYPHADPALEAQLAEYVGAPSGDCVGLAAGSDEVLRAAIDTCGLRGQRWVVAGSPLYTHFLHYARLRGLTLLEFPLGPGAPPPLASLGEHGAALREGALLYLGSPNNPTADLWGAETVASLAATYPRSTVLVDEAYTEYAGAAEPLPDGDERAKSPAERLNAASVAPLVGACSSLVVSRTFSKAFGLAAFRIGYAVAAPELLAQLGLALNPKAVTAPAQLAAAAVLAELPHYLEKAAATAASVQALVAALSARGWAARGGATNFALIYVAQAAEAVAVFRESGVLVRDRSELPGLAGWIRVTLGKDGDLGRVLRVLDGMAPPLPPPARPLPPPPPPPLVYADGVFDLFHTGHLEFLRKARAAGGAGARLLVGVITDADAGWKRPPVTPHAQRVEQLRCCSLVDEVLADPPLRLSAEFLDAKKITHVVHGDDDEQEEFFAEPRSRGCMVYVPYTRDGPLATSTSEILARARAAA